MTQTNPIAALITEEHVALGLRAGDKAALLTALAEKAATMVKLPKAGLVAALSAREALGSNGFGAGIAVPHARIDGLAHMFGLFARLEKPVPFDAIDGLPVDLVVLLLSPSGTNTEHLAVLAAISRRLRNKSVADGLRVATSPATALDAAG